MKNCIKNKNFWFPKNYRRYEKNVGEEIVHLNKIYNYNFDYVLIGQAVFVLILKNLIKNEKLHFVPNLCEIRKNVK